MRRLHQAQNGSRRTKLSEGVTIVGAAEVVEEIVAGARPVAFA